MEVVIIGRDFVPQARRAQQNNSKPITYETKVNPDLGSQKSGPVIEYKLEDVRKQLNRYGVDHGERVPGVLQYLWHGSEDMLDFVELRSSDCHPNSVLTCSVHCQSVKRSDVLSLMALAHVQCM